MVDYAALEAHCRRAFATWDEGPRLVDYVIGKNKDGSAATLESMWPAMSEQDKAYWRGLWAPLFERENMDGKQSDR